MSTAFFGHEAIRLESPDGTLAATLLPGLGGRVIAFEVAGRDLLWHDPRLEQGPKALAKVARPVWWGGWKTWIAPQERWPGGRATPPRDLDEGKYTIEEAGEGRAPSASRLVRLRSPICRETGLEIVREIGFE